jgi:SAM-dependent methyltransferase
MPGAAKGTCHASWRPGGAARVLGVDSLARLIEAASRLSGPGSASPTFQVNDVANLQAQDESFDLVVCNHLLNDLPEPTRPIREFSRVLVPGGRIVILMLHPCFYTDRITRSDPEHQGLATEYFRPRNVAQRFHVDGITSPAEAITWHRPPEFYVQALREADLWITDLREPHPTDEQMSGDPWWQESFRVPLFLLLVAQKHGR